MSKLYFVHVKFESFYIAIIILDRYNCNECSYPGAPGGDVCLEEPATCHQ